jgi:hypothetical protein
MKSPGNGTDERTLQTAGLILGTIENTSSRAKDFGRPLRSLS